MQMRCIYLPPLLQSPVIAVVAMTGLCPLLHNLHSAFTSS